MSGLDKSLVQRSGEGLRCTTLDSRDEYALYFNQLYHAFSNLLGCYPVASGDAVYEAHSVQIFLTKMLYTIETLRMKYTYNPAHSLKVDLAEAGFPSFIEMSYLAADLLARQQRLMDLPPAAMLRQAMLDHMFRNVSEPSEMLWQMSARQYFEMLDEKKLFLPFTPGRLELRGGERRHAQLCLFVGLLRLHEQLAVHPCADLRPGRAPPSASNGTAWRGCSFWMWCARRARARPMWA